jgi:hypothetical protein
MATVFTVLPAMYCMAVTIFMLNCARELADYVIKSGSLLGGLVSSSRNRTTFGMYVQALKTDGGSVGEEAIIALTNMCQREVRIYTAYIDPLVHRPACGDVIGEPCLSPFMNLVITGLLYQLPMTLS